MKNLFLFSGGGFKGAYQEGVIQFCEDNGIKIDAVQGISVGTLNASLIAQGKFQRLHSLWKDVENYGPELVYSSKYVEPNDGFRPKWGPIIKEIIPNPFKLFNKGVARYYEEKLDKITGITSMEPLKKILQQEIEVEGFKIPFSCGIVELSTGEYKTVDHLTPHDELINSILASATMPIVANPIFIKDGFYVDGGIKNLTPLSSAIEFINEQVEDWRIIIINCSTGILEPITKEPNFLKSAIRMVEIFMNNVFVEDVKNFQRINKIALRAYQQGADIGYKYFDSITIQPTSTLGDMLDAGSGKIQERRIRGYQDASKQLKTLIDGN